MSARKTWAAVVGILTIVVIAYAAFKYLDRHGYNAAVERDAAERGFPLSAIRYPAHWPLEYYEERLLRVSKPEEAEVVVRDARSVDYHLIPVSGSDRDSVLVQVFRFEIERWEGAVSLTYTRDGVRLDGADWLPGNETRVSRNHALSWAARVRSY